MPKHVEIERTREEEIAKLIDFLAEKTNFFEKPKLILIGGYGIRAFTPFRRGTRDCDFIVVKKKGWGIDEIKELLAKDFQIEVFEKRGGSGFMRCVKRVKVGKMFVKISVDFMEGAVTGRVGKEVVKIDEKFVLNSRKTKIKIGGREVEVFVPSYVDYFILKVVSARTVDAMDIAALVWKKGIPKGLKNRVKEILPYPELFEEKLRSSILLIIRDVGFFHGLRGRFTTREFDEKVWKQVILQLSKLLSENVNKTEKERKTVGFYRDEFKRIRKIEK